MTPSHRSGTYFRSKVGRDPDFDLFMARREGHGHRVYEWHVRSWAADPSHPNHAYALDYLGVQPDLFAETAHA